MLRVKEVEVAGQKFKIGNLTLGAKRRYIESLSAVQKGADPATLMTATITVLLESLLRADPGFQKERLDPEHMDDDDVAKLLGAITDWSGPQSGDPGAGEPPSP